MIKWMNALSDFMAGLGDTFVKYPSLGTVLSTTLVGLAAGLGALAAALVGGLLLTSGIGVIALVIGGITGLAVAIGALAVIHWDKIKAGIDWVAGAFQKLWNLVPSFKAEPRGADAVPGPGTMEGFMPQGWVLPPPKQGEQMIQTRVQLNLDGMRLADAVAHHIVRRGAHPHSGGQFDGSMSPTPVDFLNL
jgi:hypothetical protein